MKNIIKNISLLGIIFAMTIFLFSSSVYTYAADTTDNSDNNYSGSYDYIINNYDVNIVVNENNKLDITEKINVHFNDYRHGIFRTIPLKNNVTRLDGTVSKNRTQITNINVNENYKTSKDGKNLKIQIGSSDNTVIGDKTYIIKYTYNLGKDPLNDKDEFYYNIIGTEWNTIIKKVNFTITMPKQFDKSKLGFSTGSYGSTENDIIRYKIKDNIIKGYTTKLLYSGQALTVRTELPEGYFVNAGLDFNIMDYLPFAIPILFLIISIILWLFMGRKQQMVKTVEFYPPKGLNSLDVGFLYKGRADNTDVTSLLIYLANKGYLKIEEEKTKTLSSIFTKFKIIKLKDYDGNDENERLFFNGLFQFSDTATKLTLYDNFYIVVRNILKTKKADKLQILTKTSLLTKVLMYIMCLISFIAITVTPTTNYGNVENLPITLIFSGIAYFVLFNAILSVIQPKYKYKIKNKSTFIFLVVWAIFFGGIPSVATLYSALSPDIIYALGYIIGLFCIFGILLCRQNLHDRNEYGLEMLGKIEGFKDFLMTAEKDKLEALVEENPTYFYDILPYAYVLGVSDKWIKKFECITLQNPTWYNSGCAFEANSFNNFMNSTMNSFSKSMTAKSNSSSGGDSSSGGGSSGGGSGGGGGGSW